MAKIKYINDVRMNLVSKDNLKLYEKYIRSCVVKNKEVESTTYTTYRSYFNQFLVYLSEEWDNVGLYDDEFFKDAVDIIEGFMGFCIDELKNNKKVINTKISAISSFYNWSRKRGDIKYHPFEGRIDRMKGANDEHFTNDYFLTEDQIKQINDEMLTNKKYDIQDRIIFNVGIDSANRVGAIEKLTLSSMNIEDGLFNSIREKRGKRVEVIFEEFTKVLIKEWLELRKDMDNLEVDALFITKQNGLYKKMTKGTIQARVKKIGRIIGLEDFHCHCMRKTSLNNVMELTGDIEIAKEMANHKSTDTTLIYIKPKSKTEQRDKINKARTKREDERNKLNEDIDNKETIK